MAKTLVIAEKPSVGRDLSSALPGTFAKSEGLLESDEYVITWAVGHLVQLADPESYDETFKKWRMADLPIVPDEFHLVPRDAKSKKQLNLILKQLKREDVDHVINACDAGREGELIFAYIYEMYRTGLKKKDGEPKPVERLWISSMTKQAIRDGFEKLRPGEQMDQAQHDGAAHDDEGAGELGEEVVHTDSGRGRGARRPLRPGTAKGTNATVGAFWREV